MDRAMILRHLEMTRRHVAEGERHVVRQRELVARMRSRGFDVTDAELFLASFEQTQEEHIAHRDRLEAML